jgi:hypothetical protein
MALLKGPHRQAPKPARELRTRSVMDDPWDVRPRVKKGDAKSDAIFLVVGAAITEWERLESSLAELFDLLLASTNRAAFKVYQSSKTSNARGEMLSAAIPLDRASDAENEELATFISTVNKFAARRNEIAHGQVHNLGKYGYYLGPSNLMKSKWAKEGSPKYQYVAADIYYYIQQFAALRKQCEVLIARLRTTSP